MNDHSLHLFSLFFYSVEKDWVTQKMQQCSFHRYLREVLILLTVAANCSLAVSVVLLWCYVTCFYFNVLMLCSYFILDLYSLVT